MLEHWENRYKNDQYAYGKAPNNFFREQMDRFKPIGKILMPAEGEGRNAVYAAQKGMEVLAFDQSIEGKKKAERLAKELGVKIMYETGDFSNMLLPLESFDAAALIYAHFPASLRSAYHKKIATLIKPNGLLILQGFCVNHASYQKSNPGIGGPKDADMLFTIESIKHDFENFENHLLGEFEIQLNEGDFHNGLGKVIRFVGIKTSPG